MKKFFSWDWRVGFAELCLLFGGSILIAISGINVLLAIEYSGINPIKPMVILGAGCGMLATLIIRSHKRKVSFIN
jgi:hypothetical protein